MLKSTSEGSTMVLTLSYPESAQALDTSVYAAGIEALNAADSNTEIRSVIITGELACFSADQDARRLQRLQRSDIEQQVQALDGLQNWIDSIRTFPKPVIAVVEDAAVGSGFSLALAADFIVASDQAVFGMACASLGLSPEGGASWALARALPRSLLARTLMLGESLSAAQLKDCGLVYEVTHEGGALQAALHLAQRLNDGAPNALASTKELMNDAHNATLTEQLRNEQTLQLRNLRHPNSREGIDAFFQQRKARFQ